MAWAWRLASALIILALVACADKDRLAGAWENAEGDETIEFLKNGDVLWTQAIGTAKGTWEVVEGKRVKLSFSGIAAFLVGPQYCGYELKGQTLSLTGDCVMAGGYNRKKTP